MSAKQDRVAPRTAADIERKYNFGKKFSEILGLIDESRHHVDSVESGLRNEITKTETSISRNTEEIVAAAKAEVQTDISNVQKEIGNALTALGDAQTALGNAQTELGEELSDIDDALSRLDGAVAEIEKSVELKLDANGVDIAIDKKLTVVQEEIDGISDAQTELGDELLEISKSLEFKMDADAVDIAIEQKISAGVNVDEVETKTGYRFDAEGLKISKAGEEMSNMIDNTGMYVTRSGEDILVANNAGVTAVNLHAKTYLIIGAGNGRSRLEDYGTSRTGVFWVG